MALYESINRNGINLPFTYEITKGYGYLEILDDSDNVKGYVKAQNGELVFITDLSVGRANITTTATLTADGTVI